jgi:hypothetical protein
MDVARSSRELDEALLPVRVVRCKDALGNYAKVAQVGSQLERREGAAHVTRRPRVVQNAAAVGLVADEEARVGVFERKDSRKKRLPDSRAP